MAAPASHQMVILARLTEYCRWRSAVEGDPWTAMRNKLLSTEEPLASFKGQLLEQVRRALFDELAHGPLDEQRAAECKTALECLVSRGDFADVAIHLLPSRSTVEYALAAAALRAVRAHHLFLEERLAPAQRSPTWERLVGEMRSRLELDSLEGLLTSKPLTAGRKASALRQARRNTAEYCTIVNVPMGDSQLLTPFMLPRIEALIAANLRFLQRFR